MVEEIWLFGSRAKGTATEQSDWDFLVVVHDDSSDKDLDLLSLWNRLRDLRLKKVEAFPVRESEFQEAKEEFGTLCQIATDEGVRVWPKKAAG